MKLRSIGIILYKHAYEAQSRIHLPDMDTNPLEWGKSNHRDVIGRRAGCLSLKSVGPAKPTKTSYKVLSKYSQFGP